MIFKLKIKGVCLGADCFAFGDLLLKSTKSKQKCLLSGWPFLRQGSFTPVSLRGPAAIRHPWRGAALAASMPLGPLRETCVQPAPKSRLASLGLIVYEDQKRFVGPALAGKRPSQSLSILIVPTLRVCMHPETLRVHSRLEPMRMTACNAFCGTGFSREEASSGAGDSAMFEGDRFIYSASP